MELERLKFMTRVNQTTGRKIRDLNECWFWKGQPRNNGYCMYQTDWAKENGVIYAHQAAYKLFRDASYIPSREHPCSHMCESPTDYAHRQCCNPAHLYIANSIAENVADRDANRGSYQSVKTSGSKCATACFTSEQKTEILKLREEGMMYKDIAARYKCNRRTIERLCLGRTYKND